MTALHAALLGVIEGISEFLPISSTAHLILASSLLKIPQTEFQKSFEIAIQFGAILSVVVLYWRSFFRWPVLLRLLAAFLPTMVIGFLLHGLVRRYLFESTPTILWALFLGGIALIIFERLHTEKATATDTVENMTYGQAVLIGIFQSIALVPGVSRSAATILGGLSIGIRRRTIIDFSFLLAVPTMFAATVLDLFEAAPSITSADALLLVVGFFVSFFVALLSILWLLRFIRQHSFVPFGIYRIVLALTCAYFLL